MAFNFFKTVDEITESQALDTDLKTWAYIVVGNIDVSIPDGPDRTFIP